MGGRWVEGVVAGVHDGRDLRVFFVHTREGIAVAYPRIHDRNPQIKLGAYVKVNVSPPPKANLSMEVEQLLIEKQPEDHLVNVVDSSVQITCDATFIGKSAGWLIFDNQYLGRLAMLSRGGKKEEELKKGSVYRAVCRRVMGDDGAPSETQKTYWVVTAFSVIKQTGDRWYNGIFTKCSDQLIMIAAFDLPTSAILPARYCKTPNRQSLLGEWVQFQVMDRDPSSTMYAAKGNYSLCRPRSETRIKDGVVELLVRCFYSGRGEDYRPLLESSMGLIRDEEGVIHGKNCNGEYELWVVHHYNPNHTARWRVSKFERSPRKIENGMEMERESDRLERQPDRTVDCDVPRKLIHSSAQLSQTVQENEWITLIITGMSGEDWFGVCPQSDAVLIPHCVVRDLGPNLKGAIYRMKLKPKRGGDKGPRAYQVDPTPIHPNDIEVTITKQEVLKVWCYARIESSHSTSFTLFHPILGEATLPHKFALPAMRVGHEIQARYYRVKNTGNPTHWMVQEVNIVRDCYGRSIMGDVEFDRGMDQCKTTIGFTDSPVAGDSILSTKTEKKDRRVLNLMREFMNNLEIRSLIIENEPNAERIMQILERDRLQN